MSERVLPTSPASVPGVGLRTATGAAVGQDVSAQGTRVSFQPGGGPKGLGPQGAQGSRPSLPL